MSRPSILCGIDFTAASDEALRLAIQETKRRNGTLDLIHVWYPVDAVPVDMSGIGVPMVESTPPEELRQQLESVEIDLPTDQVRRHLEFGPTAETIVCKADELDSELLVVGTHSRGPILRWFIGSVATDLLRMSPCPILICRTPHPSKGSPAERQDAEESPDA